MPKPILNIVSEILIEINFLNLFSVFISIIASIKNNKNIIEQIVEHITAIITKLTKPISSLCIIRIINKAIGKR